MTATPARLLKLSLAHYRNPEATEEECHRFLTQKHIPRAVAIHERHGLETYSYHFSPSSTRQVLTDACAALQNGWTIDDHDLTVEFYFRKIDDLVAVATDPEFVALQTEEGPYVTKNGCVATLGWVETYIENKKVVNISEGKTLYAAFAESSALKLEL
ncbi:hypothetical protein BDZ45DRAFT_638067 [Acephala macrosclerotiorum]|nr:hypothetical protein BDZ45DRAFT_638067 [Acephala macrosclerotiorum]